MPSNRPPQQKPAQNELPWHGRFYAIRVLFTTMVLVMLAASDAMCRNDPGAHAWLLLVGAAYPHASHLLFGRFEGRRRRGRAIFLLDGLFSGAVMSAIGVISAPSAVLATINLFNWMIIGGPALVAFGAMAALAAIAFSGPLTLAPAVGTCGAADTLAGIVLIGYFVVVAGFIYRHVLDLRKQQTTIQSASDAAANARRLAESALLATLPASAARVLTDSGELPPTTLDGTTLLLLEFSWGRSESPSVADLADSFQVCETILHRHGLEGVKTFGRSYLAMSQAPTGPDDAVAAARELGAHLHDHSSLPGSSASRRSVHMVMHCGAVTAGLMQPARMNFDLMGDTIEALHALARQTTDTTTGSIVASTAAHRRMRNATGFMETCIAPGATCYVLPPTTAP